MKILRKQNWGRAQKLFFSFFPVPGVVIFIVSLLLYTFFSTRFFSIFSSPFLCSFLFSSVLFSLTFLSLFFQTFLSLHFFPWLRFFISYLYDFLSSFSSISLYHLLSSYLSFFPSATRWFRDPKVAVPLNEITRFPHAVLEVSVEHSPQNNYIREE